MLGWCLSFMVLAVLAGSAGGAGISVVIVAPWLAKLLFMTFFFMAIALFFFGRARLRT